MKSLHIEGRRWFRRGPGGTYCTARIYIDGVQVHKTPAQYGGGEYFLTAAVEWLIANGHAPAGFCPSTRSLREKLGGTYSTIDVKRERDL